MLRVFPPILLAAALPSIAASQQTLVVGPGGAFPQVQAAINAASPGDRILIQAGFYAPFTVDRGVRIFADIGALLEGCSFVNVPRGQRAILGSSLINAPAGAIGIQIRNCQGAVQLSDVGIAGSTAAALTIDGSNLVHLQDLDAQIGVPAIAGPAATAVRITNSSVTMRDSDVTGQGTVGGIGGSGIRVNNSEFFAHDSRISGGLNLLTLQPAGPSLDGTPTRSQLVECDLGGPAAPAFDYSDCSFTGTNLNNLPLLTEIFAPYEVSLGAGNGSWFVNSEGPPGATITLFLGLVRGPLQVPGIRGSLRLDPAVLIPVATLTPTQLPGAFRTITFPNVPQSIGLYFDFQGAGLANGVPHLSTPISVRIVP